MQTEMILLKLIEILNEKFHIQHVVTFDDQNIPLTSQRIGLNYIELFQFLMCIEESFKMIFTIDELQGGCFRDLQSICKVIKESV